MVEEAGREWWEGIVGWGGGESVSMRAFFSFFFFVGGEMWMKTR